MRLKSRLYHFAPIILIETLANVRRRRRFNKVKKMTPVTKQDILNDLKKLGLKEGDIVLVHSSLTAIGYVEGGANTVIDALLEAVGPSGTILMPAFPFSKTMLEYAKTNPLFDPQNTPSHMGKITEVFRCRKGALRSLFPTHSVAAIGPHAEYLVKDHEKSRTPFSKNSPFSKLIELDGYIMILGCSFGNLTSLHVIENKVDNYPLHVHLDEAIPVRYLDNTGVENTLLIKVHDPVTARTRIDVNVKKQQEIYNYCLQYGAVKTGKVGHATTHLLSAKGLEEVLETILKNGITIY